MAKKNKNTSEVVGFLGVGLDGKDELHRITRSNHFLLVGGCATELTEHPASRHGSSPGGRSVNRAAFSLRCPVR